MPAGPVRLARQAIPPGTLCGNRARVVRHGGLLRRDVAQTRCFAMIGQGSGDGGGLTLEGAADGWLAGLWGAVAGRRWNAG